MVITQPTIDDFSDTTVMRVIRKIVNYICSDSGLVAQINNNDITGFTSSYKDNVLKIDATKGDGSELPVCNVTIEGGGSSTGNPYPTAVSGTVGVDGNIKFTITMSSGSPLTTTINMNHFASIDDLSDLQKQVTKLKLTSSGNTMSINGTNAPIVNSISGSVSNGNLKISVNGVESVDIPLPESENTFNDVSILTKATTNITFTLQTIGNTTFGLDNAGNIRPSLYDTENYYRSTSTKVTNNVKSGTISARLVKATLDLESINRCFNSLSNLGDGAYLVTYYVRGVINNINISPFPSIARISLSNNVVSVLNSTDTCYYLIDSDVIGTLKIDGIDIISVMLLRA